MDLISSIVISTKKDEKTFQFIVPQGSSWGAAVDSAFEVFLQLDQMRAQAIEKAKQVKDEKKEEIKEIDAELINIQ